MKNSNVVITGASSGIGAALALRYARDGARLGLLGRNRERLDAVAAECRALGASEVIAETIDVTDRERMADWIVEFDTGAPIDLLIANAGVLSGVEPGEISERPGVGQRIFDINVGGVLNTVQPVLPHMIQRHTGTIAIVSSVAGFVRLPQTPSYSASKSVVLRYGKRLRQTLAKSGVQVSVICPGYVESPMADQVVGRKPFMISAEKAADIIHERLAHNEAVIAFPWPVATFLRATRLLPPPMREWLLSRRPTRIAARA